MDINRHLEKYYWLVAEGPRLGTQLVETAFNINDYENLVKGNGTPTVIIPGFNASNPSTFFLRKTLDKQDHYTIKWAHHRNTGFSDEAIDETIEQVKLLATKHGGPVNLIGQSLGGCYARTVANAIPDHINTVITLGSPITGVELINPNTIEHYNSVSGLIDAAIIHHDEYFDTFFPNPPVPTTSIYSESDGVVNWEHSIIPEGDLSENVEVDASHFGMGFHLNTIKIIADRLAQSKDNWKKYTKNNK